ncbi:MAG: MFS transporter [Planctomycetia bacterium]|nr:MFS transporter [Planctomycetia bacterium]
MPSTPQAPLDSPNPYESPAKVSNYLTPANSTGPIDFNALPTLYRDPSFWGMTTAQFLGAFNDTLFKQVVLLLCVQVVVTSGKTADLQFIALGVFSIPFILFSGSAGWLADRVSKRKVIIGCKVAEVAIMIAGGVSFYMMLAPVRVGDDYHTRGLPISVMIVLFLMGTHSAVFGPSKYGILPEMVRGRDLPRFNGVIQMTTFLALIFGVVAGSFLVEAFRDRLWLASGVCVLIAGAGTAASLLVRRVPVAQPNLKFTSSAVAVSRETWQLFTRDRALLWAMLIYSLFWFLGGVVQPSVNALGKIQLERKDWETGLLAACMGVGIAGGCVLAGKLSAGTISFRLVRVGAWGMVVCLALLALPGGPHHHLLGYFGSMPVLVALGLFAGLLAVPLQVFLQARPPENQKGRVIGSMNLVNWIAIIGAVGFIAGCNVLLDRMKLPASTIFGLTAVILLPVALFYRPRDAAL